MLHYNIICNKDNPYDTELILYNNNEIIFKGMNYEFVTTITDENETTFVLNLNYGTNYKVPVKLKKIGDFIVTIPLISIDSEFEENNSWLKRNIYNSYSSTEFDNYINNYKFYPIFCDLNTISELWLELGYNKKEIMDLSPLLYTDLKEIWLSNLANEVNWNKELLISRILSDENNDRVIEKAKTLILEKWCKEIVLPDKLVKNDNHKVYSIYLDMQIYEWCIFTYDCKDVYFPKIGSYSLILN